MMESESKLSETEVVRSSVKTVILASMIGTAVEFFDFYAYGTAAASRISRKSFSTDDAIIGDSFEFIDIWGRLCSPAGRIIFIWTLWG